jgi:serine/threonine-protein kinase
LSDVWAFSVVVYETISGRTPFTAASYNALMRQILEDTPPSLHDLAAADAELSAIVARGLGKDRAQRCPSMAELGRDLAGWLIAQGIHEDICGTTLETKWFGPGTVRATPPRIPHAGVALDGAQAALSRYARSAWFAAAWLLVTLTVTGLWLLGGNQDREQPAPSRGALASSQPTPREGEHEAQAPPPSAPTETPTAASAATAKQPAPALPAQAARPASSARVPPARREIAQPPAQRGGTAGAPRDPKADLLKPY